MTTPKSYVIDQAQEVDISAILVLLEQCGLPRDGFNAHWKTALVTRKDSQIVGSAVLELYGRYALLRSVAVAEGSRGNGLGSKLTQRALNLAQESGILHVYLLTETAADFFPRFGKIVIGAAGCPHHLPFCIISAMRHRSICRRASFGQAFTTSWPLQCDTKPDFVAARYQFVPLDDCLPFRFPLHT